MIHLVERYLGLLRERMLPVKGGAQSFVAKRCGQSLETSG